MSSYFDVEASANKVNNILLKHYGLSLFIFAQALAWIAFNPLNKLREMSFSPSEIDNLRRAVSGLRTDVLHGIRRIDKLLDKVGPRGFPLPDPTQDQLVETYHLSGFFKDVYNPLMKQVEHYAQDPVAFKGTPIRQSSLLAAAWGNIIILRGRKPRWGLLADLNGWFWERLKGYDYYKDLRPTDDPGNDMRLQYNRYKNNPTSRDLIIVCAALSEGLTVLSDIRSFADTNFTAFREYLKMSEGQKAGYALGRLLEFPFKTYKQNNVDLDSLPPLIIFPDMTYFATEF